MPVCRWKSFIRTHDEGKIRASQPICEACNNWVKRRVGGEEMNIAGRDSMVQEFGGEQQKTNWSVVEGGWIKRRLFVVEEWKKTVTYLWHNGNISNWCGVNLYT